MGDVCLWETETNGKEIKSSVEIEEALLKSFISTGGIVNGFQIDLKGAHHGPLPHHELPRMDHLEARKTVSRG